MKDLITDPVFAAIASEKFAETYVRPSCGASIGIFAIIGVSLAALFFDIKNFKQIGKPTLIISAIYGVIITYVVSFCWTTISHNVTLKLGLILGAIIILLFFLLKNEIEKLIIQCSENTKNPLSNSNF